MAHSLSDEEMTLTAGYVLGDLSPDELVQFERLLQQNPALQTEVSAMQVSLRLLPQSLAKIAPPPHLEAKILTAHASTTTSTTTAISTASANTVVEPLIQLRPSFPWAKLSVGIAILSALLLGADNLRLRQELSFAQNADPEKVAAILRQPNSRLVALKGEGNTAAGTLLFTPGQWQEVIVSLGNLPPLPPDQIYRMWLTLNNGKVISCGEFNPNGQGAVFIKLNPVETPPKGSKATGIFVTINAASAPLEPKGERVMSGSI
jgi:anti-sigma-K factor RskA